MEVYFPMLALDEIETELQNPFSTDDVNHLPLDKYCQTIEETLMKLLAHRSSIVHDERQFVDFPTEPHQDERE